MIGVDRGERIQEGGVIHSFSMPAIRSAACPSHSSGRVSARSADPLSTASTACSSSSGSTRRLVPAVIVTGRSVFGRTVRHGTPTRWSPPGCLPSRLSPRCPTHQRSEVEVSEGLCDRQVLDSHQSRTLECGAAPGMDGKDDRHQSSGLFQRINDRSEPRGYVNVRRAVEGHQGKATRESKPASAIDGVQPMSHRVERVGGHQPRESVSSDVRVQFDHPRVRTVTMELARGSLMPTARGPSCR